MALHKSSITMLAEVEACLSKADAAIRQSEGRIIVAEQGMRHDRLCGLEMLRDVAVQRELCLGLTSSRRLV